MYLGENAAPCDADDESEHNTLQMNFYGQKKL